jgi:ABC-2 type transport system permease protein
MFTTNTLPMSKITVIIRHEYLKRIKAKWFLVSTLLAPFGLALLVLVPVLAALLSGEGQEGKVVFVDATDSLARQVVAADTASYELAGARTIKTLEQDMQDEKIHAYVVIPNTVLENPEVLMYSRGGSGIAFEGSVRSDIEPVIVRARLLKQGADTSVIDLVDAGVRVNSLKVTEKGIEADASEASAAVGYIAGFLIYMLIFLYGSMVMRGVVEEKANRIIEVLASSVKPFELMMGKVVGIGLVGLTQLVIWAVLGIGLVLLVGMFVGDIVPADAVSAAQSMSGPAAMRPQGLTDVLAQQGIVLPTISWIAIAMFIFDFFAGYFLYASLFAAVGSAVDQEADAQSLTFPITMPIVLTMMFIGNVVSAPNGTFATVMSMIPLFSPILMTVRVAATDVPAWQLVVCVLTSTGAFFGAVWLASRIYRIGILSYGKKPSFKEIARWITLRV